MMTNTLEAALQEVGQRGSPNLYTPEELRDDIAEWLAQLTEDEAQFPETKGEPSWNLTAKDFGEDDYEDFFVAYLLEAATVKLAIGRSAEHGAIIRFCEDDFDGAAVEVIDALAKRFSPVKVLTFPRAEFERWLLTRP